MQEPGDASCRGVMLCKRDQSTRRAVVDVVAQVERAAAARPAGRLVQVLHAQALGLDELKQVGPLALLDAAEQVVLRGQQDARAQRGSCKPESPKRRRELQTPLADDEHKHGKQMKHFCCRSAHHARG